MHIIHTKPGAAFPIILAAALLQSCLVIEVVDDTPLTAGEIRVNIDVVKVRYGSQSAEHSVFEVRFFDAKDRRTELEDGMVYMNGRRMHPGPTFFSEPYYEIDEEDIQFVHDSLYTFRIVPDSITGTSYFCSVRTQIGDIPSSTVQLLRDSATVSWEGDRSLPVRLTYRLEGRGGDSTKHAARTRTLSPPQSGTVRVSLEGYDSLTSYEIESVVTGTVDPAFRSGSIESMVRFEEF